MGAATCTTIEVSLGFGKHAYEIHTTEVDTISVVGLISITFTIASQAWSKTSWAITLIRVSSGRVKHFLLFAVISMNLLFIPPGVSWWIMCDPIEKAWHPLIPGTCWSEQVGVVLGIVASGMYHTLRHALLCCRKQKTPLTHEGGGGPATVYSGIMDLFFAGVPWLLLQAVEISPQEKFGIAVAMSMGVFAAISAFIKASALPTLNSPDFPCK